MNGKENESGFNNPSFWEFQSPTDLILVVEGREFHVHKTVLTEASPVFKVMLESDHFSEKHMEKIDLPEKKSEDISLLLKFLYFEAEVKDITRMTILLDLSREYDIQTVKDRCEKYLMSLEPSVGRFVTAQDYELPKLYKKCLEFFYGKALIQFEEDEDFKRLSEANQTMIIKQQRNALHLYIQDMKKAASSGYGSRQQYSYAMSDCAQNGQCTWQLCHLRDKVCARCFININKAMNLFAFYINEKHQRFISE